MVGEFAGIHAWDGPAAAWLANQGLEYLELGRFWQILLTIGPFF
jgi:nitric oxide reductase subunit B